MGKEMIRIAVTGGAGQLAYSLLFLIARGDLFGEDQPIALHILEIPEALSALEGVKMELEDCAYKPLREIRIGTDPEKVFEGVTHAFLVGAKPRGPGMERKELLTENGKIFIGQGKALNNVADRNVKVLVVGNPCNTNCLIALHNAPNIPKKNFFAMTRLDQNRAASQLALKANVPVKDISHMTIWGNHSSTLVPDFGNARISGKPVTEKIDRKWLENDFFANVQKRGAAIIAARGKSSAASAASAALDAMKDICFPTPKNMWYSSGIFSTGNPYGIQSDIIFSFPCITTGSGEIEIVPNLSLDPFIKEKIKATESELLEEKSLAIR